MQDIINGILGHDLRGLIESIGYVGIFSIIFAESGLLIGFFLPGDSLIFTAGFLSSSQVGIFNIWILLLGSLAAAVTGDNVGYEFGKRVGPRLFAKEDSLLFHKKNLLKAQEFYDKHGGKVIILARFIPIIRTFAPIVAGIGHMDHKKFTFFNFIGGSLWVFGLTLLGYFLGNLIPDVDKYLLPIIATIVIFSTAGPAWHIYKENKSTIKEKATVFLKSLYYRVRG